MTRMVANPESGPRNTRRTRKGKPAGMEATDDGQSLVFVCLVCFMGRLLDVGIRASVFSAKDHFPRITRMNADDGADRPWLA